MTGRVSTDNSYAAESYSGMTKHPTVGVLIGNPRPFGRTTQIGREIADQTAHAIDGSVEHVVELGTHGPDVLNPDAEPVNDDVQTLGRLDLIVVASPTYKATYTGLLKSFLDRYNTRGLAGVVAVPVMVGGTSQHSLAVEVHLRPLLVELGAVVPTRGLFVLDGELEQLSETVETWLDGAATALRACTGSGQTAVDDRQLSEERAR
jgi:FMN reductase